MKTTKRYFGSRDGLVVALALALAGACAAGPDDPVVGEQAIGVCLDEGRSPTAGWSVDNGHGAVHALAVSEAGRVALAGEDGSIKLWNLATGDREGEIGGGLGAGYGSELDAGAVVRALAFAGEDGGFVAGDEAGGVRLHGADGAVLAAHALAEEITAIAASPDGRMVAVASAGWAGELALWLPEDGEAASLADRSFLWGVSALAWSADGAVLVVAGHWYGVPAVEWWEVASLAGPRGWWVGDPAELAGGVAAIEVDGTGARAVFVGAGSELVGSGGDGFWGVLDLGVERDSGDEPLLGFTATPGRALVDVALTADGGYAITAGSDGSLAAAPLDGGAARPIASAAPVAHLALSAAGDVLITSGADGVLRLWGCGEPAAE
jgi:WD40 repeat protein